MPSRLRDLIGLGLMGSAVAVLLLAAPPAAAQSAPYVAPRLIGTDHPDLNGIWQAINTANWDIRPHSAASSPIPDLLGAFGAVPAGQGVIVGRELPYQPWAEARQKENFQTRLTRPADRPTNETTGDPEAKCFIPGVPRATYMPFPFQIVQTPSQVFIAYEFASATRIIHMESQPRSPADSWMGWSIGRWEGGTLVVESTNFTDKQEFQGAPQGNMRFVERLTRVSPDIISYEVTVHDPDTWTAPWSFALPWRADDPNYQDPEDLYEFACHEGNYRMMEDTLRGSRVLQEAYSEQE